jgi:hypothetical protein
VEVCTTFARGLGACVTVKHREERVVCSLGDSKPGFELRTRIREKRGEGDAKRQRVENRGLRRKGCS